MVRLGHTELYKISCGTTFNDILVEIYRDSFLILHSLKKMVAVLQVCSDTINKQLNETDRYKFTNTEIFQIIQEVPDV